MGFQIVGTMMAAFFWVFVIEICFSQIIKHTGPIGGWFAGGMIVGTFWIFNHAIGYLHQFGTAWCDMAMFAGIGCLAASLARGEGSLAKTAPRIITAVLGGMLGGFCLFVMWHYAPPYAWK